MFFEILINKTKFYRAFDFIVVFINVYCDNLESLVNYIIVLFSYQYNFRVFILPEDISGTLFGGPLVPRNLGKHLAIAKCVNHGAV